MSADVVRVLTGNLKLVAVAVGAVALFGGTATTVSLAGDASPSPSQKPSTSASEDAKDKAKDKAEDKADDANEDAKEKAEDAKEKAEEGTRPTDTHGYCVSQAVAAAHAAGKTGRDIAAAAHSCPKPNADAKADKAAEKAAKERGKSSSAPGQQGR